MWCSHLATLDLRGKSPTQSPLHGSQLTAGQLTKGDAVKVLASGQVHLIPHVAEVEMGMAADVLDLVALRDGLLMDEASGVLADDGNVPLEHVKGNTRLGAQRIHVRPHVREPRLIEAASALVIQVGDNGDVVLLNNREARAQHGGSCEALEQLVVNNGLMLAIFALQGLD